MISRRPGHLFSRLALLVLLVHLSIAGCGGQSKLILRVARVVGSRPTRKSGATADDRSRFSRARVYHRVVASLWRLR